MNKELNDAPHNRYLSIYKKLAFVFPFLALVIAVGYFLALKSDFDASIGHFASDSVWFYISCAGTAVSAALAAVLSKLASKKISITQHPEHNVLSVFGSVFAAIVSVVLLISSATDISLGLLGKFGKYAAYLLPFIALSCILSLVPSLKTGAIRVICTMLGALSVNLTMFDLYFDFSIPLNSPVRNFTTIASVAVMLFLFSEARLAFRLDEKKALAPFTIFANASAASCSLGISVGALLSKIFAPIAGDPNMSLYQLALYAALSLIALSRLLSFAKIAGEYSDEQKKADGGENNTENNPTDIQ